MQFKNLYKNIKNNYGKLILILFLIFISFCIFYFYSDYKNQKELKIIFFDIGQGDSSLIEMPNKQKILIDAGPTNIIVKKLENEFYFFDKKIDYALLTHPDSDHIGGYYFITPNFDIKNILENGDKNKDTDIYKEIENNFKSENEKDNSIYKESIVNCGDKIDYKDKSKPIIYILHPNQNNIILNDTNKNSIVALLVYNKYSFLFTGDMDKEIENNIFNEIDRCFSNNEISNIKSALKNLTVLKVSHHGSKSASGENFIKIIKPEYSIISVGEKNKYGHPNIEAINTLEKYSKNIFYTNKNGNITFITDGENIKFEKEK